MKINKTFHLKGENNLATFFYLKKKKKTYEFFTVGIRFEH